MLQCRTILENAFLLLMLWVLGAPTQLPTNTEPSLPTITVEMKPVHKAGFKFMLLCSWKSTGAKQVSIVGSQNKNELDPSGTIELEPGSYIFIAVGPAGVAVEPVSGTGYWTGNPRWTGIGKMGDHNPYIFEFSTTFNPAAFEQFSFKTQVIFKRDPHAAIQAITAYLESLSYRVPKLDPSKLQETIFIYTSNYADNALLQQTADERRNQGELRRRAAIVLILQPTQGHPHLYDLSVLAYVVRNYPRENDDWLTDPDGYRVGNALCQLVAAKVAESVSR